MIDSLGGKGKSIHVVVTTVDNFSKFNRSLNANNNYTYNVMNGRIVMLQKM